MTKKEVEAWYGVKLNHNNRIDHSEDRHQGKYQGKSGQLKSWDHSMSFATKGGGGLVHERGVLDVIWGEVKWGLDKLF